MRILYPFNPLNDKEADEPYQDEFSFLKAKGMNCSLFDFDVLDFDEFRPKPRIEKGELILYRGWMLQSEQYRKLMKLVIEKGGVPVTSRENYLKCHHLPNWYHSCMDLTSESRFFPDEQEIESKAESLGWNTFFVKDYVKSNTTERGSIASSPAEVSEIVELIKIYRGAIEGGVVIRRVENYKVETELRCFVFYGKAYASNGEIPHIVQEVAKRIDAPFYSIDIVEREDGIFRLVELGDGQVSDKKMWSVEAFSEMLLEKR